MKTSIKNRLIKLEKKYCVTRRRRSARVLCDPDILHTLDLSQIDAEVVLILPDNGHRVIGDQKVPKGSYLVFYS